MAGTPSGLSRPVSAFARLRLAGVTCGPLLDSAGADVPKRIPQEPSDASQLCADAYPEFCDIGPPVSDSSHESADRKPDPWEEVVWKRLKEPTSTECSRILDAAKYVEERVQFESG